MKLADTSSVQPRAQYKPIKMKNYRNIWIVLTDKYGMILQSVEIREQEQSNVKLHLFSFSDSIVFWQTHGQDDRWCPEGKINSCE